MSWTTPADIARQIQRLWDRGKILAAIAGGDPLFPCRLMLKGPASAEMASEFAAIREWVDCLQSEEKKGYRLVWREVNHRVIGRNSLPGEIWVDSLDDALALIGKRSEAAAFEKILAETRRRFPILLSWLERYPLRALEHAREWPRFLNIIAWLRDHPRPGIYLRQMDIPEVHTKFIEGHRGILSTLLDLALPDDAIFAEATGTANFCRRYGFRDKPLRTRFRMLDPGQTLFPGAASDLDITLTRDDFCRLDFPVRKVFITENEVNFLAFPSVSESMVIFGSGYGFEMLTDAHWLRECSIYYWGDIDTHGFAILDQLRAKFPHVESLLMDRETLLEHRHLWGSEPQPETRDLPRLTGIEHALYDDLRKDRMGHRIRLEQERTAFSWVERALKRIE